jgi:hypothetical protein
LNRRCNGNLIFASQEVGHARETPDAQELFGRSSC